MGLIDYDSCVLPKALHELNIINPIPLPHKRILYFSVDILFLVDNLMSLSFFAQIPKL